MDRANEKGSIYMKQSYEERLKVPVSGSLIPLFTKSGLKVATSYERIVLGGRGPYVEFSDEQVVQSNFIVPEDQKWRFTSSNSYYNEYRTIQDNVKIYHQKKTVDYADYKIGMWYISPFDLNTESGVLIEPIRQRTSEGLF